VYKRNGIQIQLLVETTHLTEFEYYISLVHCQVFLHWCLLFYYQLFLLRDADMHSAYLLRRRDWLAGCPSHAGIVSKRLISKKKDFRPCGSPIILVSSDPALIPNSKGNYFSGGVKYTGVGKIGDLCAIFDRNRRFSRKRCETGQWLLWKVNRKSWVPDWMVSFSMSFIPPNYAIIGQHGLSLPNFIEIEWITSEI